jgi:exodeoxyribonuclease VII large subunit
MSETYLTTPFKDRAEVKALGARWDPERRQWFVPSGRDLTPFEAWLPASTQPAPTCDAAITLRPTTAVETATASRTGISLSQLLAGVAQAVAKAYAAGVWTRVEVVKADVRNGHVYLELAERSARGEQLAQARAIIWADTANEIVPAFERATGVVLGGGIKLLVRARPSVHPLYGMSLGIDAIDPDYTLGDLEARKREIRARLQREGLFTANRDLPPPWDFNALLVVAPQGAAGLGDFQAEARRLEQHGICRFVYAHSRFQGEGAAGEIRQTLLQALADWKDSGRNPPDAVVIIRGGGAVNDLAWLNDYDLARCLCELQVPVLTGIGHERDSTVLDEVANTRFDTPSKVIAGIEQVIVRRVTEARAHFEQTAKAAERITQRVRRAVEQAEASVRSDALRHLSLAGQHTHGWMADVRVHALQSVREASEQSRESWQDVRHLANQGMADARNAVPALLGEVRSEARQAIRTARADTRGQLVTIAARTELDAGRARERTRQTMHAVAADARRVVVDAAARSEAAMREIAGQGPAKTLGRGFAIVRAEGGQPITSAAATPAGSQIRIQFRDGSLAARIHDEGKTPE